MEPFEQWFTHKGLYVLPDGTRVVAFWTTLDDDPRWWFLAEQSQTPGRVGELKVVVYPNGSVYNFVPEMDGPIPVVYHPHASDLSIADIRPIAHACWHAASDME